MVVDLLGVFEDGSTRGRLVPTDPRAFVRVPSGADLTVRLRVVAANGVAKDLTGGVLTMELKRRPADPAIVARAGTLVTTEGLNRANFAFTPTDWLQADPLGNGAQLIFAIWLVQSSKRDAVVPSSPFILQPSV